MEVRHDGSTQTAMLTGLLLTCLSSLHNETESRILGLIPKAVSPALFGRDPPGAV